MNDVPMRKTFIVLPPAHIAAYFCSQDDFFARNIILFHPMTDNLLCNPTRISVRPTRIDVSGINEIYTRFICCRQDPL